MARLMNEKGNDDLMMMMGLGVVGAVYTNGSSARASDATALAKMVEEQEGILVPGDSPFRTIGDLVAAWKADPAKVTIGGGSSPGGPDHLFPMETARAVGVDPRKVNYITYDGGGDLLTALLGKKIDWMRENPLVCAQVQEHTQGRGWRSVVIEGRYEELPDRVGHKVQRDHAWSVLSKHTDWWEPGALKPVTPPVSDDLPHVFFRILVEQVSGREAIE